MDKLILPLVLFNLFFASINTSVAREKPVGCNEELEEYFIALKDRDENRLDPLTKVKQSFCKHYCSTSNKKTLLIELAKWATDTASPGVSRACDLASKIANPYILEYCANKVKVNQCIEIYTPKSGISVN